MIWLHHVSLVFLSTLVASAVAFVPPEFPSMELKMLTVIKQWSEVAREDCAGTLNDTEVADYANAFLNTLPTMVYNMTRGIFRLSTEVVVSPYPLMELSDKLMVWPEHVLDDVELFNVSIANYDHVHYVGAYSAWSFRGSRRSLNESELIGWSSTNRIERDLSRPDGIAGYLHEFLHSVIPWFFSEERLDITGDWENQEGGYLHSAESWNYTETTGGDRGIPIIGEPFSNWNKYYMDMLNDELCLQDGNGDCQDDSLVHPIGLGPNAWKYPSVREVYHGLEAGYLATYGKWPGEPETLHSRQDLRYTGSPPTRGGSYSEDAPASY